MKNIKIKYFPVVGTLEIGTAIGAGFIVTAELGNGVNVIYVGVVDGTVTGKGVAITAGVAATGFTTTGYATAGTVEAATGIVTGFVTAGVATTTGAGIVGTDAGITVGVITGVDAGAAT